MPFRLMLTTGVVFGFVLGIIGFGLNPLTWIAACVFAAIF